MREIRAGAAQFEVRDADKTYNLSVIDRLARRAAEEDVEIVLFNECCIPGYTFLENLTFDETAALAETVPGGPSTERLLDISRATGLALSAGLVEIDEGKLYNCQVVVDGGVFVAKHRKIHEFISDHITCGDRYTVFDLRGCKVGILTCYDNNLPENVRITALMGAEIILMPHVTGCLPSPMPGRGAVDPAVWRARHRDPVRLRQEFDGPKGRGWILRWLPARAWENGVFAVYANPIGVEGDTIKPGGSMILDPFGEILAECRSFGDEVATALLDPAKLGVSSGQSYLRARRPELYERMLAPNPALGEDRKPEVWWKKVRETAAR